MYPSAAYAVSDAAESAANANSLAFMLRSFPGVAKTGTRHPKAPLGRLRCRVGCAYLTPVAAACTASPQNRGMGDRRGGRLLVPLQTRCRQRYFFGFFSSA